MATAGSLVVRFRLAQGVERQQLRWVALAAALVPLAALVAVAASLIGGPWPAGWPIAWRPRVMRYHPFRLPTGPWDVTIDG
jgi:hypothetical protein